MRKNYLLIAGVAGVVLGLGLLAAAQEDIRVDPNASASAPPPAGVVTQDTGTGTDTDNMQPDTHALTGVEPLGLGTERSARSFLAPRFQITEFGNTNPGDAGQGTQVESATNLAASVDMRRLWGHAQFTAHYTAGGFLYSSDSGLDGSYHQFGITQSFTGHRWSLSLYDNGSYLPESPFGFYGNGVSAVNVNPLFLNNQTIFTTASSQVNNVAAASVNYNLTPRSSISMSGSFGVLSYTGAGLDSHQETAQFGYQHQLGRKDTLGVTYSASLVQFTGGGGNNFVDHNLALAYGHRVTGKLALQFSGGPQVINGNDFASGAGYSVSWGAQAGMTYQMRHMSTSLSYWHYANAGSGVFNGASTNSITGSLSRGLTRTLSASLSGGYARNTNLEEVLGLGAKQAFNTEYGTVELHHPLAHTASVYFTYTVQNQSSNTGILCNGTLCTVDRIRHVFGGGVSWAPRPLLIGR
ncbi:MAG: hypothetical protein JO187_07235 [Acidobacteria bacterium]|nr:hypothetical protein [Acidobacteriota bacterium]